MNKRARGLLILLTIFLFTTGFSNKDIIQSADIGTNTQNLAQVSNNSNSSILNNVMEHKKIIEETNFNLLSDKVSSFLLKFVMISLIVIVGFKSRR